MQKTKYSIKENKNFKNVSLYNKNINVEDILNQQHTKHLDKSREKRLNLAIKLNEENGVQSTIDKIFVVDKGHKDGEELHCVSRKGIIFILNKYKYENNINSFITILIARPNQVERLYQDCNLKVDRRIIKYTQNNVANGYNK